MALIGVHPRPSKDCVPAMSQTLFGIKLIIIWAFLLTNSAVAEHFNDEDRLRHDLFVKQNVNNLSRPVQYLNETLVIDFDMMIVHVADLDESTETLTLNCWLYETWTDLHFKWDPEKYGGIYYLPVSTSQIWVPDVYLLNSASAKELHPIADVQAMISYWGSVIWYPPATFKSICPLDLRAYPFDEHICRLMFVSWSHWEDEVNVKLVRANQSLTMFMSNQHNEWEVVSSHGNKSAFHYPDYPDYPMYFTSFYVHLRRRAPYYRLALMVPCMVTMMTTLAIFWVPPTAGEKFFIGGTNILSLTILLIHLYWVVPRSGSNIPGIVLFCGNSMLFAGLSLIVSIITTSLCRRSSAIAPPNFLSSLLSNGVVSTILCLQSGIRKVSYTGNQLLINEEEEEEEHPESVTSNSPHEWLKLAVAIDRFFFLFYCIAFIAILATAFG